MIVLNEPPLIEIQCFGMTEDKDGGRIADRGSVKFYDVLVTALFESTGEIVIIEEHDRLNRPGAELVIGRMEERYGFGCETSLMDGN